MTNQSSIIRNKLDHVINGLEHIDIIEQSLIELGASHKNIGITHEMFDILVELVVESAAIASNHSLNDFELSEWKKAFRMMSDSMLKAY